MAGINRVLILVLTLCLLVNLVISSPPDKYKGDTIFVLNSRRSVLEATYENMMTEHGENAPGLPAIAEEIAVLQRLIAEKSSQKVGSSEKASVFGETSKNKEDAK